MPRRLNFTGRKKINRADAAFRVLREGGRLSFTAELCLPEGLDPAALVHVEAYRGASTLWKRFSFGRVAAIFPPVDRSLDEFGTLDGILFRVKVAATSGALLAEADAIRPLTPDDDEQPGTPLIKPMPGDTGRELWRVAFDDDMPVLLISHRETAWKELVREPTFRALVAPAAMRQILTQILILEPNAYDEDDESQWQVRWLHFCESLPGVGEAPDPPDDDAERSDARDWIDDAVSAFCARTGLVDRFLQLRHQETAP